MNADNKTPGEGSPAAPAPAKPWYSTGYQGVREERVRIAASGKPRTFWLKPDSSGHLLLLDDKPFVFDAHEYKQGDEREIVTCHAGIFDEPSCCEILGNTRSLNRYAAYPAIDLDGYQPTDPKKPRVKNFYTVLLAKVGLASLLEKELADEGSLIGRRIRFSRSTDKSARAGDAVKCVDWVVGSEKVKYLDERLWGVMYKLAEYKGKSIGSLLREAAENPEKYEALNHTFDLDALKDRETGKLMLGRLPLFNFPSIYAPKSPKETRILLAGATSSAFQGDKSKDKPDAEPQGGGTGRADDTVPF